MIWLNRREIKEKIYNRIVHFSGTTKEEENIHTEMVSKCSEGNIESIKYIKNLIGEYLKEENAYTDELMNEIFSENYGAGIIDKYETNDIDEIIVIGKKVLLKKQGDVIEVPEKFNSYDEVEAVAHRITSYDKIKDLNKHNPLASGERADGARIQVAIPYIARCPILNIRYFDSFVPTPENMIKSETFTEREVEILSMAVKGGANIFVIGGPETGKTSTVKWLIKYLNDKFIIGLLETDFEMNPELLYPHKHFISLREREGYSLKDLFAVQLRQSIDLAILTETRRKETNELIDAMTRGMNGSMGTGHITGADNVPDVLTYMIMEGNSNILFNAKRNQVADAIDIVIEMKKLPENEKGQRKKICGGIYELIAKGENVRHETIPLSKLIINKEQPHKSRDRFYGNTLSDKLKNKYNENGIKMSYINEFFPGESR